MVYRWQRTQRMIARPARLFTIPLVMLAVMMALAASGVAAYPAVDGPQLLVDRIVLPPGMPVTVTLNQFPAMQQVVLHVRPSLLGDQAVNTVAFPGTTDMIGSGTIVIPTTGFSPGNYIVSVATVGSAGDLDGVLTAFAIVDAGFTGPRVVGTVPLPGDD